MATIEQLEKNVKTVHTNRPATYANAKEASLAKNAALLEALKRSNMKDILTRQ